MWSKLNQPLWIRKCIVLIQLVSNTHWLSRHSSEWRMYQRDKWVIISQRAYFTLWCKLEAGVQREYIQNGKVLPWINLCILKVVQSSHVNLYKVIQISIHKFALKVSTIITTDNSLRPAALKSRKILFQLELIGNKRKHAGHWLFKQSAAFRQTYVCWMTTDIKQKKHIVAKQMPPASCVGTKKNKTLNVFFALLFKVFRGIRNVSDSP